MSNPYTWTCSGRRMWLLDPAPGLLSIVDIAGSLSRQCRYNGELRHDVDHYSVAQHSVLVSQALPPSLVRAGLLHDAAEAYLGDISAPVKQLISGYAELEERMCAAIAERWDVTFGDPLIKRADLSVLLQERLDLLHPNALLKPWPEERLAQPLGVRIYPLHSREAELLFLQRALELGVS